MDVIQTLNWQIIINIAFGVVCFFGGWLLKVIFGLMDKMQEDYKELNAHVLTEYKELHEDLTSLALSIPEKYLRKDDFKAFTDRLNERFDMLEEKLDRMR